MWPKFDLKFPVQNSSTTYPEHFRWNRLWLESCSYVYTAHSVTICARVSWSSDLKTLRHIRSLSSVRGLVLIWLGHSKCCLRGLFWVISSKHYTAASHSADTHFSCGFLGASWHALSVPIEGRWKQKCASYCFMLVSCSVYSTLKSKSRLTFDRLNGIIYFKRELFVTTFASTSIPTY
jgi:hypothetical protein